MYHDFPYNWIKFLNMSSSFVVASLVSYPFYYIREMVDIWPKEKGGHCTWGNSYSQAIRWLHENMDILFTNFFTNFWVHMIRRGIPTFFMLWMLDNAAFFTNSMDVHNGLETMSPIYMESV